MQGLVRTRPANEVVEQLLLGTLLMDNQGIERVNDFLRPEHFLSELHQNIYQQIENLLAQGKIADPRTLQNYIENGKYLLELAGLASTIIDVQEYGKVVFDLAIKRKLIHAGEDIVNEVYSLKEESADVLLDGAEQKLYEISDTKITGGFVSVKAGADAIITAIQTGTISSFMPSGFSELDEKIQGFKPSDLIILAGRPGMGKTALALNLALNCCQFGSVGIFSLEMSEEQLINRMLSQATGICTAKFASCNKEEIAILTEAAAKVRDLPLFIDDTAATSMANIRTRARRLKRQHDLKVLFIDYLQLIRGSAKETRLQEITEISRGLKALAKEFDIPVIALSALSRAVEAREDKRPRLSDLRDSGTIEQDADIVTFLYIAKAS